MNNLQKNPRCRIYLHDKKNTLDVEIKYMNFVTFQ